MNDSRSVKCGLATLMFVYYTQVDNERIFVQFSISFANATQIYVIRDLLFLSEGFGSFPLITEMNAIDDICLMTNLII